MCQGSSACFAGSCNCELLGFLGPSDLIDGLRAQPARNFICQVPFEAPLFRDRVERLDELRSPAPRTLEHYAYRLFPNPHRDCRQAGYELDYCIAIIHQSVHGPLGVVLNPRAVSRTQARRVEREALIGSAGIHV